MYDPTTMNAKAIHERLGPPEDSGLIADEPVRGILKERIAAAARAKKLLTYSELVRGVKFSCPSRPEPFEIITFDWKGVDRHMMGHTLAQILRESVLKTGCVPTAIVVDSRENQPSSLLFEWLERIGVVPDLQEGTVLAFWAHHVAQTHLYFRNGGQF